MNGSAGNRFVGRRGQGTGEGEMRDEGRGDEGRGKGVRTSRRMSRARQ